MLVGSFFKFSSFSQLDLQNQTCVASLCRSISKNWIENQSSPYLVMVIGIACLLIPECIRSSPMCSLLGVG